MAMAFREELRKAEMVLDLSAFEETSVSGYNDDQAHRPRKAGCKKKTLNTERAFRSHRASLVAEGEVGDTLEDVVRRLKGLHLLLDDVLFNEEFQSMNLETRASLQRTAMEERDRLEAQKKKELAKEEAALQRQSQRLRNVVEFANNLMTLTGASPEHPWILKLFEVAELTLDPRDLLGAYKSEDETLAITDKKNPRWCWLPYVPKSKKEVRAMSRGAALEALVGDLGDGRKLKGFLYTPKDPPKRSPRFVFRMLPLSFVPLPLESAVNRT